MFKAHLVQIVGIILIVSTLVFFVKNYLIKLLESQKNYKNICLILLALTILICSIGLMASGFDLEQIIIDIGDTSNSGNSSRLIALKLQKTKIENSIIHHGIIDFIAIVCLFLLFINIKREINSNVENKEGRWDWSKIS